MILFERLNEKRIFEIVDPDNQSHLAKLEIFETIASTNTYLLEQAKTGAPCGFACFAEQQTQGRGRLQRTWHSPFGKNIYFSLLWRFGDAIQNLSGLSIAVAVMVANALRKYGIQSGVQLKWPNDVMITQRKLAGILLECNDTAIVIGIGLNLDVQDAGEAGWIGLSEVINKPVARNFLAGLLLNELLKNLPLFAVRGLPLFLPEWQKHDVLFNKTVVVRTPDAAIQGVMRGVDEQGQLLLQQENGLLQSFCYGEVSVRPM